MNISGLFPSNYLKAEDIPNGREVALRIDSVDLEDVGGTGKAEDQKPVLRFQGKQKGLVLNKTNASMISETYGDETGSWHDRDILLYATSTIFQGRPTPCLRVRIPPAEQPDADKDIPF